MVVCVAWPASRQCQDGIEYFQRSVDAENNGRSVIGLIEQDKSGGSVWFLRPRRFAPLRSSLRGYRRGPRKAGWRRSPSTARYP